jgi:hypothetical protein
MVGGLNFAIFEMAHLGGRERGLLIGGATQIMIAGAEDHRLLVLELHRETVRTREITF